jgi:Baseplate J-like protein
MARDEEEVIQSMVQTVNSIDPSVDVTVGPIYDFVIRPTSKEVSSAEGEAEHLSQLYSLDFVEEATDAEVKALGDNFGIGQGRGTAATGFLTFYTYAAPSVGTQINISRGTLASTQDGRYTYQTTEAAVLSGDTASSFFNATRQIYEITVRASAVSVGEEYDIPPYRVTKLNTNVSGINGVENRTRFQNGTTSESRADYVDRIQDRFLGMEIGTSGGLVTAVKAYDTSNIKDVATIFSTDHTLFRRKILTPGIDVYVIGEVTETTTENYTAIGGETSIPLRQRPVLSVTQVKVNGSSVTWEFIKDDSKELGGSVRANDYVLLATPLNAADIVEVQYTYNKLLIDISDSLFTWRGLFGTDILVRTPWTALVTIDITVTILANFGASRTQSQVDAIIREYVEPQQFVDALFPEVLREQIGSSIAGVSTVIFNKFTRSDFGTLDTEVIELLKYETSEIDDTAYIINIRQ